MLKEGVSVKKYWFHKYIDGLDKVYCYSASATKTNLNFR